MKHSVHVSPVRFRRIAAGEIAWVRVVNNDTDYQTGDNLTIYGRDEVGLRDARGRFAGRSVEHVRAIITHCDATHAIISFKVLEVVR